MNIQSTIYNILQELDSVDTFQRASKHHYDYSPREYEQIYLRNDRTWHTIQIIADCYGVHIEHVLKVSRVIRKWEKKQHWKLCFPFDAFCTDRTNEWGERIETRLVDWMQNIPKEDYLQLSTAWYRAQYFNR